MQLLARHYAFVGAKSLYVTRSWRMCHPHGWGLSFQKVAAGPMGKVQGFEHAVPMPTEKFPRERLEHRKVLKSSIQRLQFGF